VLGNTEAPYILCKAGTEKDKEDCAVIRIPLNP
jgi:hypothetical protein